MDPDLLSAALKRRAAELGFRLAGVCRAATPSGFAHLAEWLERGYGGEMDYLADRYSAYEHPRHVMEGVRSLVMLGLPYDSLSARPCPRGYGKASRYAWGSVDYHDVVRARLRKLADYLHELAPQATTRVVVDTAPLLEREFAQRAGLGWVGKNTLLLNRQEGSYFFLAALLTNVELVYDAPATVDHCGNCTACLDACPTQAFAAPYVLDASRCISYLTIEQRSLASPELRRGQGDWIFGCDVCQEVCPWNRFATPSPDVEFQPLEDRNPVDLAPLFSLSDEAFRERFRRSPFWRPRRRGLLRNAAIALGNQGCAEAMPALVLGLNDAEPLVRCAAAWALGQLRSATAADALKARSAVEQDAEVQREIGAALQEGP